MTIFVDDVNLPEINEWGDQITNEFFRFSGESFCLPIMALLHLCRAMIELKGFYSLEKPGDFHNLVDVQVIYYFSGCADDILSNLF